jgi:hypothetical protein
MERMAVWAVIIPAEQWATERLFHNESVRLAGARGPVAPDEEVLLVAGDRVVALARAAKTDGDDLLLTYLRRGFDEPVPAGDLTAAAGGTPTEVDPEVFGRLAGALSGGRSAARPSSYLVSVALPVEAATPADAVRQFWSHVRELGPAELPAYVWPYGDELAMQAFVLGAEANQDPEEDDEDD